MKASSTGSFEAVRALVEWKATVDFRGHVRVASLFVPLDLIRKVIDRQGGRTALWQAARAGHARVIRILADAGGADLNLRDSARTLRDSGACMQQ